MVADAVVVVVVAIAGFAVAAVRVRVAVVGVVVAAADAVVDRGDFLAADFPAVPELAPVLVVARASRAATGEILAVAKIVAAVATTRIVVAVDTAAGAGAVVAVGAASEPAVAVAAS